MAATASALEKVNDDFHRAYDEARGEAELDGPVLVLLVDTLHLVTRERRSEHAIRPPWIDSLKSAAHAPVAAFAILHDARDREISRGARAALSRVEAHVRAARAAIDGERAEGSTEAARLLDATGAFLAETQSAGVARSAELDRFAAGCRADLMAVTESATRAQLAALDEAVTRALATLDAAARSAMQVVVAGDHQARARSLGMQYFRARLGEKAGVEHRVSYGENVATLDDALALVGKRRLDRALAQAFFGDARRLQRDVLGDVAADILVKATLEAIA